MYALQTYLQTRLIQIDPHHSHPFQDSQLLIEYGIDDGKLLPELLNGVKSLCIRIRPNLEFLSSYELPNRIMYT